MRRWKPIRELLDHRLLNEIEGLGDPTLENLARFIYDARQGGAAGSGAGEAAPAILWPDLHLRGVA